MPEQEAIQDVDEVTTPVNSEIDENDSSPPGEVTMPPGRYFSDASPQQAEVSSAPEFDPDQLRSVGMTAEQAKQRFGTPDALDRAVAWQAEQAFQFGNQQRMQQQPQRGFAPNNFQQQQEPPRQRESQAKAAKKFDIPMPSDWDDDSKKALNALNDHYTQRLSELEDSYQQRLDRNENVLAAFLEQNMQQLRTAQLDQFDQAVNGLGEKWSATFGKGSYKDMDEGSREYGERAKLFEATAIINNGRRAQGLPPLPLEQAIQWGLATPYFRTQFQSNATQQLQGKVDRRQGQFVARPTARKEKPLTADERAESAVGKILERRGVYTPEVPTETIDSV